jgi:hypothetical protein
MKRLALLLLAAAAGCSTSGPSSGGANGGTNYGMFGDEFNGARHGHPELNQYVLEYYTPDMTLKERDRKVARAWDWEGKQFADDVDMVLLLRPQSRLTKWNLR